MKLVSLSARMLLIVFGVACPPLLSAQGVPYCVSDTVHTAQSYRAGYASMVSRTDSQSVAQRTNLGLPTLQPTQVTIVSDTLTCRTASTAFDNAVGVSASTESPIVLQLGTQWIVIKQLKYRGVRPNVLFNQAFTIAQMKIWF
jgi:hypothetical protein